MEPIKLLKSKTFLFSLFFLLSIFCFFGCSSLNNNTEEPSEEELLLAKKKAAYALVSGKTFKAVNVGNIGDIDNGDLFTFTDSKLIIEDEEYEFDINKDIYLPEDITKIPYYDKDNNTYNPKGVLFFCRTKDGYTFKILEGPGNGLDYTIAGNLCKADLELVSDNTTTSSSTTENSSNIEGTYSFSNATGSQVNGSITLNSNGTWSYSGSKTTLTPGTYSVNNNELTLNWTSKTGSYTLDRTDTFTVSVSGSEATLTSKGSGISAFFSDFFGITSTMTLTLSYSSN